MEAFDFYEQKNVLYHQRSIRVEKLPLGLGVNDWRYSKSPDGWGDRGLIVRQISGNATFQDQEKPRIYYEAQVLVRSVVCTYS